MSRKIEVTNLDGNKIFIGEINTNKFTEFVKNVAHENLDDKMIIVNSLMYLVNYTEHQIKLNPA